MIEMANHFCDEDSIRICVDLLSQLTSPAKKSNVEESQVKDFEEVILSNLHNVRSSSEFSSLKIVDGPEFSWIIYDTKSRIRWNFVSTCLQLLETIRCILHHSQDEKAKLLSVSQKKVLENSFQFVVPLAVLPYLLPGVGVSPEAKSKHIKDLSGENLKDFAKYRRLCFVMDSILKLKEIDIFHEIITSKYLEDVLAALFQLSFAPIKKPSSEDTTFKGFDYVDDNFEVTEMSFTLWNNLESNKKRYKDHLFAIQKQTYRPLVIRKYLVLLDAKKTPRWMKQNLTKMLTDIILEDGGVVALIRAIVEVDSDSPMQWSHCDVVARLISNTALNLDKDSLKLLIPQILKILRTSRKQQYELVYIQVINLAVKQMFSMNSTATMEVILNDVLDPLKQIEQSNEDQISSSIEELYNLCIFPSTTCSAMQIDIISSVICVLFRIHCKIKDGVSHLKSPVKELLGKFFLDAEQDNLVAAFDNIIFNEPRTQIVQVSQKCKFIFTTNGGVSVIDEESDDGQLENGIILLDLIKNVQDNDRTVNALFIYLLKKFITLDSENNGEKRLIAMLLLTNLSQNQTTLRQILKNSENIIQFIKDLLVMNSDQDTNLDIICVCLTFLTMVLYDLKKKKDVNWKPLDELRAPLETLKKSKSPEVKILADEVYNLIVTRSLIGSTENKNDTKLIEVIPSACEEAFENACDNLLPVRAHGVMELISLLNKRDTETLAKIDKILCLFQENLKDADSYLYLRAIEGLSTIALLKPDKILSFLCEEFISCENPETRLKLGEILMRTVKLLKDFVPNYKHLLINCFLSGAKSSDHLIRASSLSNLGEVCLMLKYNIEDVIHEILYCARNIALNDPNPEARRAGVFLISSILRGLETYMFKVLEPVLLDLYKILQKINQVDEDEVTRVHAKISLDVLNENTKQFFNPKPSFEKKIHVLDQF